MNRALLALLFILLMPIPVIAAEGMINVESSYTVEETASRLEKILTDKGMTIFARIGHSEGAANVGIKMPETELLVFGNPKVGSPLMKCQQTVAIDLPQKALIWADGKGSVWVSYNEPKYLSKRHNISGCDGVLAKIEKALAGITAAATRK